jgi:hypothetical protein
MSEKDGTLRVDVKTLAIRPAMRERPGHSLKVRAATASDETSYPAHG